MLPLELSKTKLKPSASRYNASLLVKPYFLMVLEPQLRYNPEFWKSSRYFPFLDNKYFPAFKRPLRAHESFLQFPKKLVNVKI